MLWLGRARYALSESGDSGWAEQGALSGQNWICSGAGDSAESGESADSGWVDFG